jgi:hypothetical protein
MPYGPIDWDRVAAKPATQETPAFVGNKYNVDVTPETMVVPGKSPGAPGVTLRRVAALRKLGVAWVRRDALLAAVASAPEIVGRTANAQEKAGFYVDGVMGGSYLAKEERFLALLGKNAWVDMDHPSQTLDPIPFEGCVGMRAMLR